MRYIFAEGTRPVGATKEVLAAVRRQYKEERFVLKADSIFITSTESEEVRLKVRAFCIGYAVAKRWRP